MAVGRQTSFWMRAAVCLLRDRGAWRLFREHKPVLFPADGTGTVMPEDEAPGTGRKPLKLEPWPGSRHKKGDDDDGKHCSFICAREKSI